MGGMHCIQPCPHCAPPNSHWTVPMSPLRHHHVPAATTLLGWLLLGDALVLLHPGCIPPHHLCCCPHILSSPPLLHIHLPLCAGPTAGIGAGSCESGPVGAVCCRVGSSSPGWAASRCPAPLGCRAMQEDVRVWGMEVACSLGGCRSALLGSLLYFPTQSLGPCRPGGSFRGCSSFPFLPSSSSLLHSLASSSCPGGGACGADVVPPAAAHTFPGAEATTLCTFGSIPSPSAACGHG